MSYNQLRTEELQTPIMQMTEVSNNLAKTFASNMTHSANRFKKVPSLEDTRLALNQRGQSQTFLRKNTAVSGSQRSNLFRNSKQAKTFKTFQGMKMDGSLRQVSSVEIL